MTSFLFRDKPVSIRVMGIMGFISIILCLLFAGVSHALYYENAMISGKEKLGSAQRLYFTNFNKAVNKGKENLLSTVREYSRQNSIEVHIDLGKSEKSRAYSNGEPIASNLDYFQKARAELQDNRYALYANSGEFIQQFQLNSYGENIIIVSKMAILDSRQQRIILSFYVLALITLIVIILTSYSVGLSLERPLKQMRIALELNEARDIVTYNPYKEIAELGETLSQALAVIDSERTNRSDYGSYDESPLFAEKEFDVDISATDNESMENENSTPSTSSISEGFFDDESSSSGQQAIDEIMAGLFERPFARLKNVESALFPVDIDSSSSDFYVAQQYNGLTRQFALHFAEQSPRALLLKHRLQERFLALAENDIAIELILDSILKVIQKSEERSIEIFLAEFDADEGSVKYYLSGYFKVFKCAEANSTILETSAGESMQSIQIAGSEKLSLFSGSILEQAALNNEQFCSELIQNIHIDATARGWLASVLSRLGALDLQTEPNGLINVLSRK